MTTQPEALHLAEMYADRLHDYRIRATKETLHDMMVFRDALEAELRRLHAVNEELLEALEEYVNADPVDDALNPRKRKARAAIAKAGGEA